MQISFCQYQYELVSVNFYEQISLISFMASFIASDILAADVVGQFVLHDTWNFTEK